MKTYVFLILASLISLGQGQIARLPVLHFATIEEGREVLMSRDAFIQRLSPFDRAARMQTDQDVTEATFLAHIGEQVRAWTDAEAQRIQAAYTGMRPELQRLAIPFPEEVLMITTTGREEGGAAYTRANAIILPAHELSAPPAALQKLIAHELFHILSRNNPEWKTRLYRLIGFHPCKELVFPPSLAARKITNPDAPLNGHCIQVTLRGKRTWAIPILHAQAERYDPQRGGRFFDYLKYSLLEVQLVEGQPTYPEGAPRLVGVGQAKGFYDQVGRNTSYVIHPEEILADNFALMIQVERNLKSPELVQKMRHLLSPLQGRFAED
ncbi:MAG: hypothetical protein ACI9TH_003456 [Kiritimatiellia bacterium]|jgi:hypothetical protein